MVVLGGWAVSYERSNPVGTAVLKVHNFPGDTKVHDTNGSRFTAVPRDGGIKAFRLSDHPSLGSTVITNKKNKSDTQVHYMDK